MSRPPLRLLLPVTVAAGLTTPFSAAGDPGWVWDITPYLWAAKTKYDLVVDDTPISSGEVKFNDLYDVTDTSFQVHSEATHTRAGWGGFLDITYIRTSDSNDIPLASLDTTLDPQGDLRVESRSEQWFIDAGATWWPSGNAEGPGLYAGIRYTGLEDKLQLSLVDPAQKLAASHTDRNFTDALIGARYRLRLNESWRLLGTLDYSDGESRGILVAQALVSYALGSAGKYHLLVGYRYKKADYRDDEVEERYEYRGPLIGFRFRL